MSQRENFLTDEKTLLAANRVVEELVNEEKHNSPVRSPSQQLHSLSLPDLLLSISSFLCLVPLLPCSANKTAMNSCNMTPKW